jgi:glutathione S-transferase
VLTLYYCPGACSMASHITLEESGLPFEGKPLRLGKGEAQTPEYLAINPRGKVPALVVDGRALTENVAIMSYVASQVAPGVLLPVDAYDAARAISTITWFSNSVHPPWTHLQRPERFADDAAAHDTVKTTGRQGFIAALQEIDAMLAGKDWLIGNQFTVADAYALVFYGWGARIELSMKDFVAYTAHKQRMLARPAVRRVLEREQGPLLTAA